MPAPPGSKNLQATHRPRNCVWPSKFHAYVSLLRRQQAEVIQNRENANVHNIGQGEAMHRMYKGLELGGSQAYYR